MNLRGVGCEVGGTGSECCRVACFGISDAERLVPQQDFILNSK
jgi:hypothetical protein